MVDPRLFTPAISNTLLLNFVFLSMMQYPLTDEGGLTALTDESRLHLTGDMPHIPKIYIID